MQSTGFMKDLRQRAQKALMSDPAATMTVPAHDILDVLDLYADLNEELKEAWTEQERLEGVAEDARYAADEVREKVKDLVLKFEREACGGNQ